MPKITLIHWRDLEKVFLSLKRNKKLYPIPGSIAFRFITFAAPWIPAFPSSFPRVIGRGPGKGFGTAKRWQGKEEKLIWCPRILSVLVQEAGLSGAGRDRPWLTKRY